MMQVKSRPWLGLSPTTSTAIGKATTPPPSGVDPAIIEPNTIAIDIA